MHIRELKKQFDTTAISTIEKEADACIVNHLTARKEFIGILFYLERTKRFKENKTFKDATFGQYISDRFHLLYGTYHRERRAFFSFPHEAEKHGVGVVSKAITRCGPMEAKKVFSEIGKASRNRPMKRDQIEKIIEKHSKPKKEKPILPTVAALTKTIDRLRAENIEQAETIKTQYNQIQKLRATVKRYQDLMSAPLKDYIKPNNVDAPAVM